MWRLLGFLAILGAAAWGLSWLADNPGSVAVTWRGVEYDASVMVALGVVLGVALALMLVFAALRLVLRAPALISLASRARRREKGFQALSLGMIAVGAGEAREAQRYAREADRHFADEPLTLLLRAQTAQLSGDRAGAVAAFNAMLSADETLLLGLRGLHVEATRAGEAEAALQYAKRAYARAALPWAARAVLDDYSARGDWAAALGAVEANARAGLVDKPTAQRWRAVLKTALARERADRDPKAALALAREALDLAPALAPAAVTAAKLSAAAGDLRRAAKILETAYRAVPHPDLADAYMRLRAGDSGADRLARAKALARVAPNDPESALLLARGALEAQDLVAARRALGPLLQGASARPSARACLLMAEIEEAAGDDGAVREWLARAARAPRDRAWVADGVVAEQWAPAGPNGALDAFVWRAPPRAAEPTPLTFSPAPSARPPSPASAAAPPTLPPRAPRRPSDATSTYVANAPDDPGPHGERPDEFRGFALE